MPCAALLVVGQILVVVVLVNFEASFPIVLVVRWQFRGGQCCVPFEGVGHDLVLEPRVFGMPPIEILLDPAVLVGPTKDVYWQCYYHMY